MRILALETTLEACSVALLHNERISFYFKMCPREQTKYVLPMIYNILKKNKLKIQNLDAIAYSQGPGNFTGVRINVGVAQSLSFAYNIPLIAISTLALLAQGTWRISKVNKIISIIDARVEKIYWAQYYLDENKNWIGENSETLLNIQDAIHKIKDLSYDWIITTTNVNVFSKLKHVLNFFKSNEYLPTAKDMIPLALKNFKMGRILSAYTAKPIYLKN